MDVDGKSAVIKAVAAAMGAVKRIAKENKNTEQRYNFASVDDFMAMVGPICAEHGLVTIIDEECVDIVEKQGKFGQTQWVSIMYRITTFHADGGQLPTVKRHAEVIRSGPQAFGAAQSYVLKQYYRGLFAIPTGDDDDPDFGRQKEEPARQPPRDFEKEVADAIAAMEREKTLDSLGAFYGDMFRSSRDVATDARVVAAKDKRKAALAPITDDVGY